MKVAALIPARKGSKGIPNKNFKNFCGEPLYEWTAFSARDSSLFDTIILSTDFDNTIYPDFLRVDIRPEDLCTDSASLDDVLVYHQNQYPDIDIWCLLQPTSPLRTAQDIKNAYAMMLEKETTGDDYKYDSLVSVYNHPVLAWINNSVGIPGVEEPQAIATYRYKKRPNRQDRKDWYLENGAIYFTRKYVIEQTKCRLHGFVGLYVMPKERSIEIDDMIDWNICEMLMEKR
jgi:CMP-N,N'-diacetyllegionaminic acid synthase